MMVMMVVVDDDGDDDKVDGVGMRMRMCTKCINIVAMRYQMLDIFYSQAFGTAWQRGCIWRQFYLHTVTHLQHCA